MDESYHSKLSPGVEKKFRQLEMDIMLDVVRRIRKTKKITSTADWQLTRYKILGNSDADIQRMIDENVGEVRCDELFAEVVDQYYTRDRTMYMQHGYGEVIPAYEENDQLRQLVNALISQSNDELYNISKSMGFMMDYGPPKGKVFTPLADIYNEYIDQAIVGVASGAFDYNSMIRKVVTQMTNSGLRSVDYASGHTNRVDVAARRAIMTGLNQLTGQISDMNAQKLGTDFFEVSWHAGARPDHATWQGKVYSKEQLHRICGLGTGAGLLGWNCRHTYYPFIPEISVRNYTDEWLEEQNRKEAQKRIFRGTEYNAYEATQKQRQLETRMRAQREKVKLLEKGDADLDDIMLAKCKYQAQIDEYKDFCEQMDMKTQFERVYYDLHGRVAPSAKAYKSYRDNGFKKSTKLDDPPALVQIPQIPASTVIEKVKDGTYSLKLSWQNYNKHSFGTSDYFRYRNSREFPDNPNKKPMTPQSILTISYDEAQKIINERSGTGIIKTRRDGSAMDIELIRCDNVIGSYYTHGEYRETKNAAIHHGKRGSHLVPVKGGNYG